ncbi:MAG: imidazole glycerol phosphate synthase subunit HisH [Pseudanabaenaceae cyanobacterium bins.39]|nr:imidazole glycerol phosphate synthase subunit HisH [Pseudanabaenaceae cyanobacterium bins.39]
MNTMPVVAVIDYDMGNLHSACKGLEMAGAIPKITHDPQELAAADGIVLPGVGSFDPAMQKLRATNLETPIHEAIASGKPFLGICLGMQILFDSSEEGQEQGLGIISGQVRRFQPEPNLTIPHMGWNQLDLSQPSCPLWQDLSDRPWMYFVHSYYTDPTDPSVSAATTTHGSQTVTVAIAKDNVMAVQFHPEKSSSHGIHLLTNFVRIMMA